MPQFVRKRRPWDWLSANELAHLPVPVRQRLQEKVNERIEGNPARILTLLVAGIFVNCSCLFFSLSLPLFAWSHVVAYPSFWLTTGIIGLVFLLGTPYLFLTERWRYRRYLRELMLAEGIKPCYCFECGYYVEGFEGDECPNCDAALVKEAATWSER